MSSCPKNQKACVLVAFAVSITASLLAFSECGVAPDKTPPMMKPKLIPPTPEMNEAILKTLQSKLSFLRADNNDLYITSGAEKTPVNLAFRVFGKRFRGSGDWEAFSNFACPAYGNSTHTSIGYGVFSGLEGGKTYKFKFKFVPNKDSAKRKEAAGMDYTYYNGEIETDWMELAIPPIKGIGFNGFTDFKAIPSIEANRDDALFENEWKEFKITTGLSNEYWMLSGGFFDNSVKTWPFRYNPKKPAAFCLKLVALESKGVGQGALITVYNVSPYFLYQNTGFPLYGLDGLFPALGEYQFGGRIHFFSMSGDDMVKEKLAVEKDDFYQVGVGALEAAKALGLLDDLKNRYPYHSIELPAHRVMALEK